jgi:hypothetical protein
MDIQPIKFTYTNSLVAFIDILGFSDLVNKSRFDSQKRKKVEKIVNFVRDMIFNQEKILQPDDPFYLKVSFISDSIVISTDAPQSENDSQLLNILKYTGSVGLSLLAIGVTCRGSIVTGKIFHLREPNFNTVVGTALVNAYNLEKTVAVYPRIVVDNSIYNLFKEYLATEYALGDLETWKDLLKLDQDGEWFINIFHQIFIANVQTLFLYGPEYEDDDILKQAGISIIEGLKKSKPQTREQDKYNWLLSQYLPYAPSDFKELLVKYMCTRNGESSQ